MSTAKLKLVYRGPGDAFSQCADLTPRQQSLLISGVISLHDLLNEGMILGSLYQRFGVMARIYSRYHRSFPDSLEVHLEYLDRGSRTYYGGKVEDTVYLKPPTRFERVLDVRKDFS
jgi:hypothetical protein